MVTATPTNYSASTFTAPGQWAAAVTPSDTVNITGGFRALYIGVAGNVALVLMDDSVVNFVGLLAGSFVPMCGKRVNATNTTATSIVYIV